MASIEVGLFNAETDELIALLTDGVVIDPALIADIPLTIAATVPEDSPYFGQVGSIKLDLDQGTETRTESAEPYALFGDKNSDYRGIADLLADGAHDISFELYSGAGAKGTLLEIVSLDFTVSDGPANIAPVAGNDAGATDEDNCTIITVLTNDSDAEGDTLTVSKIAGQVATIGTTISLSSGATATLNADGTISYAPNGAFEALDDGDSSSDTFSYTVSDSKGGEATASVTVSISGVTDPTVPTLTVFIDPSTISENGGTATGTVTRDADDISAPLTVTLSSNDESEATVPATVTIAAGQTSATIQITAVDDGAIDGTQSALITATAATFVNGSASLSVTDDEVAPVTEITVVIIDSDSDEIIATLTNGASIDKSLIDGKTLTISATVPEDSPYFGQVESIKLNLNDGQNTRTESVEPYALFGDKNNDFRGVDDLLPDGANNISFELYDGNSGLGTLLETVSIDFTVNDGPPNNVPVAGDDNGATDEDNGTLITVLSNDSDGDNDPLTVSKIAGQSATVGVAVTLSSGATATLNADGTIFYNPNGAFEDLDDQDSSSDTFSYRVSDGKGGEATASVTVAISGVTDPTISTLTVTIDSDSISENGGSATGTVTREADDISAPLVVTLASSDTSEATVPATVTIAANQTSATFAVTAIDDADVDGTQQTLISATATDFVSGSDNLSVTDDEVAPITDIDVVLIDADTDEVIANLSNGASIDKALIEGKSLTISATVPEDSPFFGQVESIKLNLNDGQNSRTESVEPYALFGDKNGDFKGLTDLLIDGANSISFELYEGNGGTGDLLNSISVEFSVERKNNAPVAMDDVLASAKLGELLINEYTDNSDSQRGAAITTLADGRFVVTWQSWVGQQGSSSDYHDIRARIFNADGTVHSREFAINQLTSSDQTAPSITALKDGGFVVAWESFTAPGDTSLGGIMARIFDADGSEVASEFLVNEFTNGPQYTPSMTSIDSGGFVITWESSDGQQGDDNVGIKARVFNADGTEALPEFLVNEFIDGSQTAPKVTAIDANSFVVTWRSSQLQGDVVTSAGDIKARIFNIDGINASAEFLVNQFTEYYQEDPSVTATESGQFWITWSAAISSPSQDGIRARIFSADGTEVSDEFRINQETTGNQFYPSVKVLTNGNVVVAWLSNDRQTTDIKAAIFQADGTEVVQEFLVQEISTGIDAKPVVAALDGGGFVVSWSSIPFVSPADIKARIFDAEGEPAETVGLTDQRTPVVISSTTLLENDSDADGDTLIILSVDTVSTSGALISINDDGTFTYDPNDQFDYLAYSETAVDSFNYTVSDENGATDTATAFVTIRGANRAPTPLTTEVSTSEDLQASGTLQATDIDGDELTFKLVTDAENGSVTVSENGAFSYSPNANFNGLDKFTYSVSDGEKLIVQTVSVTVDSINDAPVVQPQTFTMDEDGVLTGQLIATDPDAGDTLTFSFNGYELFGYLELNEDGSFVYTPEPNDSGIETLTYTVTDGTDTVSGEFTIVVQPVNDVPVATNDNVTSPSLSEFIVNVSTEETQWNSNVTTLSNGDFLVTWEVRNFDFGDNELYEIYGRIFDAEGNEKVSEFQINTLTEDEQSEHSVTALANGGFLLSWQSGTNPSRDIKGRIFDNDGTEVVSEFRLNDVTDWSQDHPNVAARSDGGFIATWVSYDGQQGDTSASAIKARVFDPSGAEIVEEFLVNQFTENYQVNPEVAVLNDGGFVVTWWSDDPQQGDNSGYGVKARVFNSDGSEAASEFLVNELTNDQQGDQTVAALKGGGFVVAWTSNDPQQGDDSYAGIKARVFDDDGVEVVSEFLVNAFTNDGQVEPFVFALDNGGFVVTWYSYDLEQGDNSLSGIKARVFDASGEEVVSEFLVNELTNSGQYGPAVSELDNGQLVFTWTSDDGQQGDASDGAVKARIFNADGTPAAMDVITEDTKVTFSLEKLLANDFDEDGDLLSIVTVDSSGSLGDVTLNEDGSIDYDPTASEILQELNEGETAVDSFSYTISDGNGATDVAMVTITVLGLDDFA